MVHLVIPCFQESSRVGPFIEDLKRVFAGDEGLRILLVDDGSPAEEQKRFLEVVDPLIKDGQLFLPP